MSSQKPKRTYSDDFKRDALRELEITRMERDILKKRSGSSRRTASDEVRGDRTVERHVFSASVM